MASSGRTESDGTVGPLLWLHLYIWTDVNYYSMLSESLWELFYVFCTLNHIRHRSAHTAARSVTGLFPFQFGLRPMENALAHGQGCRPVTKQPNGKRPCPRSGLQARYQTAKQQQNSRVFDAGVTYNPNPVTLGISGRAVNVICARHRSGGFL